MSSMDRRSCRSLREGWKGRHVRRRAKWLCQGQPQPGGAIFSLAWNSSFSNHWWPRGHATYDLTNDFGIFWGDLTFPGEPVEHVQLPHGSASGQLARLFVLLSSPWVSGAGDGWDATQVACQRLSTIRYFTTNYRFSTSIYTWTNPLIWMMIPPLIPFIENSCCFAALLIHQYIHLRYHSHSPSVSIFFNDPIDQSRMSGMSGMSGMVNTFTTKSQRFGPVGLRETNPKSQW